MQTIFLVWLPGLGGLLLGGGLGVWLTGIGWRAIAQARAIRGVDKLVIQQGLLLKEISGTSSDYLPEDINNRINQQLAHTEAVTRKELT